MNLAPAEHGASGPLAGDGAASLEGLVLIAAANLPPFTLHSRAGANRPSRPPDDRDADADAGTSQYDVFA
jgi:hypothetical protein